jgi:hypothetical protein
MTFRILPPAAREIREAARFYVIVSVMHLRRQPDSWRTNL